MRTTKSRPARHAFRLLSTLLLPTMLTLALTACGISGETPADDFHAAAGTLNFSNGPGLSLMYTYNLREVPADNEIEVTITGPEGWNDGESVTTTAAFISTGKKWSWRNIFRANDGSYLPVESGTYTVEAHFNGRTYTRTETVDSSNSLAAIENLRVVFSSETEVSIDWGLVPSAQSYQVELYSADTSMPRGTFSTIVTNSEHTFDDVALQTDGDYYVAVHALPVDFTLASPEVPEGQFNTAFAATSFTFGSAAMQRQSRNSTQDVGSLVRPMDPGEGSDVLPLLSDEETAELANVARQSLEGSIADQGARGSGTRLRWDKSIAIADDDIALLVVRLEEYPAIAQFTFVDESLASATLISVLGEGKFPVCHTPPGNTDTRHTLMIDLPAVKAHYLHGDEIGYCEDDTAPHPGVDLAIVDLTDGTTTLNHYAPAGDTITAIGPWYGSSTLDELFTPVPAPSEPEWVAKAAADINYTGPGPETQDFWTSGAEEDLDDGGGGSDGKSGDDTSEDDSQDDPGSGNDGDGESEEDDAGSTCDWAHLENLHQAFLFARTIHLEIGVAGVEAAELALSRARRDGFRNIAIAGGVGMIGGAGPAIGAAFGAGIIGARLEQDAIEDLAAARAKEARLEGTRNEMVAKRTKYYIERNCADIAHDHASVTEGLLLASMFPESRSVTRAQLEVDRSSTHTPS